MSRIRPTRVLCVRLVIFRLARHGHRALFQRFFRPLTVTLAKLDEPLSAYVALLFLYLLE
jgi:hypothetical protein